VVASRKERRASLFAVGAEMAFPVAGLFFGIGQRHRRDPDALRLLFSNLGAAGSKPGILAVRCDRRWQLEGLGGIYEKVLVHIARRRCSALAAAPPQQNVSSCRRTEPIDGQR
jgi:hypothetical protein